MALHHLLPDGSPGDHSYIEDGMKIKLLRLENAQRNSCTEYAILRKERRPEGQIQIVLAYTPDRLSRKYAYQILLIGGHSTARLILSDRGASSSNACECAVVPRVIREKLRPTNN